MLYIDCFERVYSYRLTEYVVSELCARVSHVVLYFSLSSKHASACSSGLGSSDTQFCMLNLLFLYTSSEESMLFLVLFTHKQTCYVFG